MQPGGLYAAGPVTPEFAYAAQLAQQWLRTHPDEAVRLAAYTVPVVLQPGVDPLQDREGGCPGCTYLGMWAQQWPGYLPMPHGTIWMFENGIRRVAPQDVYGQALRTLEHELDHALQRNHVLDHLREIKSRGMAVEQGLHYPYGYGGQLWSFPQAVRGCG